MKLKKLTALLLTCTMLSLPVFAADNTTEQPNEETNSSSMRVSREYEAMENLVDYISGLYIDPSLTKDDMIKKGISNLLEENPQLLVPLLKEIFRGIDDYSELFTASEYQEYVNSINQVFYGIGVSIQKNGDYVEITGFSEENSPAEQIGLQVGDKIAAINDEECHGKSLNDVRNLIIGELNTKVHLTILRNNELLNFVATRIEVRHNSVTGGVFEGNIGYMKISTFGEQTADEFEALLNDFREKGVKKIILDLRDNGGGRLASAVTIAQKIVPKGKIIDVVYRDAKNNVTYNSDLRKKEFDFITLVNENTASSSEILASAIQDSGAGKLLGTTTYGKGIVQQTVPLTNGMYFKLTVAEYKTRNGKEINRVGLEPDEYIVNETKRIDSTIYHQFDFKSKYAMGDSGERVIAAKERLSMLNYYAGNVTDPVFDDDLRLAITAFQVDYDLCGTGVLDIPTQVKIRNSFEQLETVIDTQLESAYKMFGGNPENLYKE